MKSIFCLLLTLVCQPLIAAQLTISEGYLRATPPGQMMSSAYMQLTNDSEKDIIIRSFLLYFLALFCLILIWLFFTSIAGYKNSNK